MCPGGVFALILLHVLPSMHNTGNTLPPPVLAHAYSNIRELNRLVTTIFNTIVFEEYTEQLQTTELYE
jgi:hypothetical protein